MNKEAFLKSFKRYAPKYQWELNSIGWIRTLSYNNVRFCPITFLHYVRNDKIEDNHYAYEVGCKKLGLKYTTCLEIIRSADNLNTDNPRLRARLLKIVGLS